MKDILYKVIKDFDRGNMLVRLLDFPLQIEDAKRIGEEVFLPKYRNFKKILFSGLGGSAIGGDLVRSYLYLKSPLPIFVNREYILPSFVDNQTLVFICSYSGNTEETISSYREAKKKNAKIIVISSGGVLKDLAKKDKIPHIQIPSGFPPRSALGYLSITPLVILNRLIPIKDLDEEIEESILILENLKEELKPEISTPKNQGKRIAFFLFKKFVITYSTSLNFDCCAIRFRAQIAENSKQLGSVNLFPELNHNEIEGFRNPKFLSKDFVVLILRGRGEPLNIKKRIEITKRIIEGEKIKIKEVFSRGKGLLAKIFSLIYSCDFISFYLAILNEIDPTPVEKIGYLKKELTKR